jgi:oxalate---CoA ligase
VSSLHQDWVDAFATTARLADVDGTLFAGQDLRTVLRAAACRLERVAAKEGVKGKLLVLDPSGKADAVAMVAGIATSVVRVGNASAPERTAADIDQWVPDLVIGTAPVTSRAPQVTSQSLLITTNQDRQFTDESERVAPHGRIELRTSGSTGEPKLVPLRWDQLASSAQSVAAALELLPTDVTLVVMPLGHVHGLVASLLAPLVSGGTTVCAPGFDASAIPTWFDQHGVTWMSAVPTMLRQFLTLSEQTGWMPQQQLRFLRSASSVLPVSLLHQLEDRFQCPVVEAYGMTEASHQICSGTPTDRQPGSVGRASGPRVRVVDASGLEVQPGQPGEVEIRGHSVTTGYLGHPVRNENQWLATGDLGWTDANGRLWLQGRRKEVINRGGETIAPRDVDDALCRIEGVTDAIAFAVPHEQLGEVVGAVVVLNADAPGERAIRHAMLSWVDHRHVPVALLAVDAIPTGPTGKPDREVARTVWSQARSASALDTMPAAAVDVLDAVRRGWRTVLGVDTGDHTNFLAVGGDSLRAMELVSRLTDAGLRLTIVDVASAQTIEAQASLATALRTI